LTLEDISVFTSSIVVRLHKAQETCGSHGWEAVDPWFTFTYLYYDPLSQIFTLLPAKVQYFFLQSNKEYKWLNMMLMLLRKKLQVRS
jgi:hypothetical protein